MYYAEKARKILSLQSLFMDDISEELSQIKVSIKDIFNRSIKLIVTVHHDLIVCF